MSGPELPPRRPAPPHPRFGGDPDILGPGEHVSPPLPVEPAIPDLPDPGELPRRSRRRPRPDDAAGAGDTGDTPEPPTVVDDPRDAGYDVTPPPDDDEPTAGGGGGRRGGGFWGRFRRRGGGGDDGGDDGGNGGPTPPDGDEPRRTWRDRARGIPAAATVGLGNLITNERVRRAAPYVGVAAVGAVAAVGLASALDSDHTSFSFDYGGVDAHDHGGVHNIDISSSSTPGSPLEGTDTSAVGTHSEAIHHGHTVELDNGSSLVHEGPRKDVDLNHDGALDMKDSKSHGIKYVDSQGNEVEHLSIGDKGEDALTPESQARLEQHGYEVSHDSKGNLTISEHNAADNTSDASTSDTTNNSVDLENSDYDRDKSAGPIHVDADAGVLDSANGPVSGEYVHDEGGISPWIAAPVGAAAAAYAYHRWRNRNRVGDDEVAEEEPTAVTPADAETPPATPLPPEVVAHIEAQDARITALEGELRELRENFNTVIGEFRTELARLTEAIERMEVSRASGGGSSGGGSGAGGGANAAGTTSGHNNNNVLAFPGGGGNKHLRKILRDNAKLAKKAEKQKAGRKAAEARVAELEAALRAAGVAVPGEVTEEETAAA